MNNLSFIFAIALSFSALSQSYAPAPGNAWSTAIHKDSSIIVNWATGIDLRRGYLDISDPSMGDVSYGVASDALGPADGSTVVSLGDSGVATLTFDVPITNGTGPDFAIFENGFTDDYMEFAFVEVSSDGVTFVRFPSHSEVQTVSQIDNFSFSDCRMVHNLAGKYRTMYGTPFDLEEISGSPGIDVNAITHIRLIDVVGSIDPLYGSVDSFGNLINDPYPTSFESGGFDLDGVAVIHEQTNSLKESGLNVRLYPNPTTTSFTLELSSGEHKVELLTSDGRHIDQWSQSSFQEYDVSKLNNGMYLIIIDNIVIHRVMIK